MIIFFFSESALAFKFYTTAWTPSEIFTFTSFHPVSSGNNGERGITSIGQSIPTSSESKFQNECGNSYFADSNIKTKSS